ncbi:MAG: tetratricopeptide repeat protein, partial [Gemmataceae bacterium]|nr:tetratricopeptide repeat protein [Gemmataceae bacterium]
SIPTDLETIILKAIRKNSAQRYATAAELADDLRRFVNGEPIRAKRPTLPEAVAKWARRHKALVGGATAVAVVALAAVIALLWQGRDWAEAERARAEAELEREEKRSQELREEKARTEAKRQLAEQYLKRARGNLHLAQNAVEDLHLRVAESGLRRDPDRRQVYLHILEAALRYCRAFVEQNRDEPAARTELARTQGRMADILRDLGKHKEAEKEYREASDLFDKLRKEFPRDSTPRFFLALNQFSLAHMLLETGRLGEAEKLMDRSVALSRELVEHFPKVPEYRMDLAKRLDGRAKILSDTARYEAAEKLRRETIDRLRELVDDLQNLPAAHALQLAEAHALLGQVRHNLAVQLVMRNEPKKLSVLKEAREHLEKALANTRTALKLTGEGHYLHRAYRNGLAGCYRSLATVSKEEEQPQEAEKEYRRAVALLDQLVKDFPSVLEHQADLAFTLHALGGLLQQTRRPGAEAPLKRAVAIYETVLKVDPRVSEDQRGMASSLNVLGQLYAERGDLAQARPFFVGAVQHQLQAVKLNPKSGLYRMMLNRFYVHLTDALARRGEHGEALRVAADLPRAFPESTWREHVNAVHCLVEASRRAFADNQRPSEARTKAVLAYVEQARQFLDGPLDRETLSRAGLDPKEWAAVRELRAAVEGLRVWADRLDDWSLYWDAAEQLLRRAEKVEKDVKFSRAQRLQAQRGDAERAQGLLAEAAQRCPDDPKARLTVASSQHGLAELFVRLEQPKQADRVYRRAIALLEPLAERLPSDAQVRSKLGAVQNNLGLLVRDRGLLGQARRLFQQAVVHQKAALKADEKNATSRVFLRNHYWGLTETLLRQGEHRAASETARDLPRLYPNGWEEHIRAAGFLARCVALAAKDEQLTEEERPQVARGYGDEAVVLLRGAVGNGWQNAAAALKAPVFDPLRARADFRQLLAELEGKGQPQ